MKEVKNGTAIVLGIIILVSIGLMWYALDTIGYAVDTIDYLTNIVVNQ